MSPQFGLADLADWASYFRPDNPSSLDRLAAAIFVNSPNDPRGRLMATYSAYFDASGNAADQPFLVVAGYISSYIGWQAFENVWKSTHESFGVQLPFHMSELIAATARPEQYARQHNARADYVELARTPQRANDFFKQLCIAEIVTVHCVVTCIVPMDVYRGISSLLELREVVPPYAVGASKCIEFTGQWEEIFGIKQPIECIFEEGDFEQGKFTDLMRSEGRPLPIYRKKDEFVSLQAADHYAWERAFFAKTKQMRASARLLEMIPTLQFHIAQEHLIDWCHKKGIDPKTGIKK